jgi:protein SSD1
MPNYSVPERELEQRKDLRQERVFTIDPETAKDLDDALSIKKNEDGTYDVGVHIADVSFFVKPNTALDRDARKRATSVYLVQRAVPMLPPTLSEQICSLVPGQDRLAFSAIFTISEDGKISKKWFGKTVIRYACAKNLLIFAHSLRGRSAAQLSYKDAQSVLDGKPWGAVAVAPEHEVVDVQHDIKLLQDLAQKIRARRQKSGFLALSTIKLTFAFDENGLPIDTAPYDHMPANELIEEVCTLKASVRSPIDICCSVHAPGEHVGCTADCSSPPRTGLIAPP